MKRAVSVSLGSTQRDKRGELRVLGELVECGAPRL
jgi:hypothetical protein